MYELFCPIVHETFGLLVLVTIYSLSIEIANLRL
jgi:hypothetical protein